MEFTYTVIPLTPNINKLVSMFFNKFESEISHSISEENAISYHDIDVYEIYLVQS